MSFMFDGARLKQARLAEGLSQDGLARAAETSQRNIVRWENNQNVPRAATVTRLAVATGHPVEFFYTQTEDGESEPTGLEAALVNDLIALVREIVRAEARKAVA